MSGVQRNSKNNSNRFIILFLGCDLFLRSLRFAVALKLFNHRNYRGGTESAEVQLNTILSLFSQASSPNPTVFDRERVSVRPTLPSFETPVRLLQKPC